MAVLYPSLDKLDALRVPPTEGERHLLYFLDSFLDDTYEVFFQPFLNGDNPDVIILREGSGVMIIEVKDWDLDSYELTPKKHWQLKNVLNKNRQKQLVKSPIEQVFEYKKNLYNLHIESLLEKRIKNPKLLSVVTCAVYFHFSSKNEVDTFLRDRHDGDEGRYKRYLGFLSHFEILGRDCLTKEYFSKVISKRWLDRKSFYFDTNLYKSFKRYLKPPLHLLEQGVPITYTNEQQRVIISYEGKKQKVKGVAGSGKTLALAKRAVNSHIRHGEEVLILTYNISLRNYIRDKISEVRSNFEWKYFTIMHYHKFIKSYNNNHHYLDVENPESITQEENRLRYKTIIVDEIQDYTKEMVRNVLQLLSRNGEFIVFGDEKQNIYGRELENDKKPYTGIGGAWNILNKSFRVSTEIANLATQFQKHFFGGKYEYDEIIVQKSLFDLSKIRYYYIENLDINSIMNIYTSFVNENSVHDNDVCIQSPKVDVLRDLCFSIRHTLNKKTKTMFETLEVYNKLKNDCTKGGVLNKNKLKEKLYDVRRNKKFHFWMNSGTTKLSTIHSFKGWEIATLFLIIDSVNESEDSFTTDELIYTAITRCRQNLIVVNAGNKRYDSFFKQAVENNSSSSFEFN